MAREFPSSFSLYLLTLPGKEWGNERSYNERKYSLLSQEKYLDYHFVRSPHHPSHPSVEISTQNS